LFKPANQFSMKLNRLLEKQIKSAFPAQHRNDPAFADFFAMVSKAYDTLEHRVDEEVALKRASVHKLKEVLAQVSDDDMTGENDLFDIAAMLKKQVAIFRDTRKKQKEQQQFYENILNFIPADIAVIDKEHRYLYVNPSAVKDPVVRQWIIGKTDEEYHAWRNHPPALATDRRRKFDEVLAGRKQTISEEHIVNGAGKTEYHLRILNPVYHEDGELDMLIAYGVNITERKEIEEKVRLSEERYRSIFNNSQALICTHDMQGRVTDVNETIVKTLGFGREQLLGRSIANLLPPGRQHTFDQEYLADIKANGRAEGVMVAIGSDGRKKHLLYQNYMVVNGHDDPFVIGFSQDITDRVAAESALRESEEKYRRIIENMHLGLLQVSPQEEILYANQSFCRMSGYTLDEIIGKSAVDLFVDTTRDNAVAAVHNRRRAGESDAYELQVKDRHGENKWWLISGAPVFNDDKGFVGSIGIHLDITSQKALELELRKAKADAEHSARAKEVFLANMSHEIRTPMNAIIGLGRLLAKTSLDKKQRHYLDVVRNASDNLLVIINDLLDFSKIEAGKVTLEHIGFSLCDYLSGSVQILRHKAEEKGLALTCRCVGDISPVLIGDPYRLNQVLMNLFSNAIKFTEHGQVTLTCTLLERSTGGETILFEVKDTGIGMSGEFQKHLFDKFTQEDESITRRFGGTGLGMSICKQLIELMGGSIRVESARGSGTTISFAIRFATGSSSDLPKTPVTDADMQVLKNKNILLVEDNAVNRLLATTILSQYGANIVEAEDGAAAIERLREAPYDVILMDMRMPVMNGLDATRYIRANIDKTTPIIALTANAFRQEEQQCLEAGMNDFISKPFDEDKFVQLLAQWLGKDARVKTKPARQVAVTAKPVPDALFDLAQIRAIASGDDSFAARLTTIFMAELKNSLAQMEEARKGSDWRRVADIAHRMKPSMKIYKVSAVIRDMEQLEKIDPATVNADKACRQVNSVTAVGEALLLQLAQSFSIAAG